VKNLFFILTPALFLSLGLPLSTARSNLIVFSNLTTPGTIGYAEPVENNLLVGDSLTLTQPGPLAVFGATVFNSRFSPGPILTGQMTVNFYDNTTPYAGPGPITNPLLGSAVLPWDFTSISGLQPGDFDSKIFDLTSRGINLPTQVLITQQFTQTAGSAASLGAALLSDPTIGFSPKTFYLNSTATPENLYTRAGNPGQFGYDIELTPEPSLSITLFVLFALVPIKRPQRRSL